MLILPSASSTSLSSAIIKRAELEAEINALLKKVGEVSYEFWARQAGVDAAVTSVGL